MSDRSRSHLIPETEKPRNMLPELSVLKTFDKNLWRKIDPDFAHPLASFIAPAV